MNESSGMRATLAGAQDDDTGVAQYDFYVNADNIFLQTELKATRQEPELVRAKFKYGMALIGLGALRATSDHNGHEDGEEDAAIMTGEELVAYTSDAMAPMLLPMIEGLGGLELDDGEAEPLTDSSEFEDSLIE